jgi:hypothetical protein
MHATNKCNIKTYARLRNTIFRVESVARACDTLAIHSVQMSYLSLTKILPLYLWIASNLKRK